MNKLLRCCATALGFVPINRNYALTSCRVPAPSFFIPLTKLLILLPSQPLLTLRKSHIGVPCSDIDMFMDQGIIIVNRCLSSRHRRAVRHDSVFCC